MEFNIILPEKNYSEQTDYYFANILCITPNITANILLQQITVMINRVQI